MTAPSSAALNAGPRGRPVLPWFVAALVVAACWLLGTLVDPQGVAFSQIGPGTVPGGPIKVSSTAGTTAKRRPQLALDSSSQVVYLVWEEGTGNTTDLYYSWRDPATGDWGAPRRIGRDWPTPGNADPGRWAAGTGEFFPHIQVDPNGNLHVAFGAERSGSIGRGAYYTVGTNLTGLVGTESWTAPLRLDCSANPCTSTTSGSLQNLDNTRLFVRDDPSSPGTAAVGYILWTGNTDGSNKLRLSRVRYTYATSAATAVNGGPPDLSNPVTTSVGPVAVLEIGANTLQLVYAGKNLASGNGFWGAPLTLSPLSWGTRTSLAGANGDDCSVAGCTGATATHDGTNTWIAANIDLTSPTVTHAIQVTVGGAAETLSDTRAGRQPVIVFDQNPPTTNVLVVYDQCTYVSSSSCTSKDIYYRVRSGSTWGAANLTGSTTGEQRDLTAVMVDDDLHYAWVGTNQTPDTGDNVYFQIVQAP